MSLTLFEAPMSSSIPALHALLELNIPFERVTLDLKRNDQKATEFLKLNPNGKVPTLVVDQIPMFEGLAIIIHLGERFGVELGLWPAADSPERPTALAWSTWAYVTYGSAVRRLYQAESEHVSKELHHAGQARLAREDLRELLAVLDEHLSSHKHILGDTFSLADVAVANTIIYSTFFGVSTSTFQHVDAWTKRFRERPTFAQLWTPAPSAAS
ncbi:MAG: glutathione S-transferase family protein [Myxococcales bacterium]|nr:glutathione S-transferase family protein [Myxococcales bacterium]MCB9609653.1 glutathione S-transferase family protein [Polyangiaceae bacterium]